jgi:catechol 2,3-dioxygenase-like lactoylglutathione lyase family enzyme
MTAVRYFVTDLDRSIAFYSALGFVEEERWGPAFAIVARDSFELWLSGPGTSAAKPMLDGRLPEPGGWNRIVVTVDDIEATAGRLRELGAKFRNDVTSGPGGSQVLVEDPDANPVEIFQAKVESLN